MQNPAIQSAQIIETAAGIALFGFDADDQCVLSLQGLEGFPAASLSRTLDQAISGDLEGVVTRAAEAAALYDLLTETESDWDLIAEHDGRACHIYEDNMGRSGLRLAGAGYVLGLFHRKPEGNWFELAGIGSIWNYTFRSPVEAEAALDELGQDCEIHAISELLAQGCVLV